MVHAGYQADPMQSARSALAWTSEDGEELTDIALCRLSSVLSRKVVARETDML
jgi:hypothetical protein